MGATPSVQESPKEDEQRVKFRVPKDIATSKYNRGLFNLINGVWPKPLADITMLKMMKGQWVLMIVDGEVVGGCTLHDKKKWCFMMDFCVAPEHRRKGYGSDLLNYVRRHCRKLIWAVEIENREAMRFYESNGARQISSPEGMKKSDRVYYAF